jgi:hypothetical protein
MPYPYLGTAPRVYPAYLDLTADKTLDALPGGQYWMAPAQGAGGLPVPPGDGLWGEWQDPPDGTVALTPPARVKITRSKAAAAADEGE